MRKILHFLLLCSAMYGAPTQAGAAHIGIVTAVKGAPSQKDGAIALMDQIQEAGVLRLAAGGEVVAFLYAGAREYTLTGPGVFVLRSHGVARTSATGSVAMKRMDPVFEAIATPRAGLVQAGATVRSSAAPVDDTSASCEAIDPARPVFRWPARSHIGNYEVMLADANGQVLYRTEAVDNQAAPPDALRLAPGAEFRLELTWREPGGQLRLRGYDFWTLDAHHAQAFARLRPDATAPPEAKVLFCLWVRSLGAWSLAEPYLE